MISKRSDQQGLFDVGNVYALSLSPDSFHAQLARGARGLFTDDAFSAFYSDKYGRPSVPPSLLAITLILQWEAGVSDREAIQRTAYDLRWAAVLGRLAGEPLCARSTLELFRAQIVLHDEARGIFQSSIKEARRKGLLKGKALSVAMDTKPIEGRGAVEDTYNLLATGIRQAAKEMAKGQCGRTKEWLIDHGFERYAESSIKGSAEIDWSDPDAKEAFLSGIVSDARRLLEMAEGSDEKVRKATDLLRQLLLQDIEEIPTESGDPQVRIREGTVRDRIPSATDPDQRHGRKSKSKCFAGSKASVVVDTESQIVLATEVLPGNAGDATEAIDLVEQAEENTGEKVEEVIADCAYGGKDTRESFEDAGLKLIAKVPSEPRKDGHFVKSEFQIDLKEWTVTCPAEVTISEYTTEANGRKIFKFGVACRECPLRDRCTNSARGRSIGVHPREELLIEARAYQQTKEGREKLRSRVVVEHALARLGRLGIGQARYIGIEKTRFQLAMAATVANLRRTWNWEQEVMESQRAQTIPESSAIGVLAAMLALSDQIRRYTQYTLSRCLAKLLAVRRSTLSLRMLPNFAFRPGF